MCGIAGFFDTDRRLRQPECLLREMGDEIAHRGPDGRGEWYDPRAGVGLAHRRLSIIDLSDAGAQPMRSESGRYFIAFNGEIYNFESLRSEIQQEGAAPHWRGHSDTEVLLACIEHWGVARTLEKCNGMFAFALWDTISRELVLARDRFGEKPLYYGWCGNILLFGSELKAIGRWPGFSPEIDPEALRLLFRFSYIPAPYSIWKGFHKLPPATWLRLRAKGSRIEPVGAPQPYWSALECAAERIQQQSTMTDDEIITNLEEALLSAVGLRMRSDVPLGAFLSGGVDSSVVVAAMQLQSSRPVNTYSISYSDPQYDEGPYAKAVATHLGTNHTDLRVEPALALNVIPKLPNLYDEPFADVSQIPTYLVSQLARSEVSVVLSGDGGDELFGGYTRYVWGPRLWKHLRYIPRLVRRGVGGGLKLVPRQWWDGLISAAQVALPAFPRFTTPGFKLHRFADICGARDEFDMYEKLTAFGSWSDTAVWSEGEGKRRFPGRERWPRELAFREAMMLRDTVAYLPDDVLTKVDRASMAVSLEVRAPFLDVDLFGLAWGLPGSARVRNGEGKWALRQVLARHLPEKLFDRPKMGFGVPFGEWLRVELREWAETLLSDSALNRSGLLDAVLIRRLWRDHCAGRSDNEYGLWPILMFQSWLNKQ